MSAEPATTEDRTAIAGDDPPSKSSKIATVLKVLAVVAVVAGLVFLGRLGGGYVERFAAWVDSLGAWGPLVFVLGYAVATVAFLPGSILTLAAGVIFGLGKGTLYATLGALLGSSAAFLIARYLARGAVEKKLEEAPKFAAVDRAVGQEGWKMVALLRLSPGLPYNLLNYALGLTKVPFLHYLVASLAMLPGTLLYVYYGTALGNLAALASDEVEVERGAAGWVLFALGLVATVVATWYMTRKARRAIQEQMEVEDG